MPEQGAGRGRGGRQAVPGALRALPGEGRRLWPGGDAGTARGGRQAGKEAAPGRGCGECPARSAGSREGHRLLLPGLWGGADGRRPSHGPPQRSSGTPSLPGTRRGPGALSPPPGRTPLAPTPPPRWLWGPALLGPSVWAGGFSQPPVPGVLPLRRGARPDRGRDVSGTEAAFLGHPASSFYPAVMKGEPVAPGRGPRPPQGLPPASLLLQVPPKPCSSSPGLQRAPGHPRGSWQSPSTGHGAAGPPQASLTPLAGKKIIRRGSSPGRGGYQHRHTATASLFLPRGKREGRHSPTAGGDTGSRQSLGAALRPGWAEVGARQRQAEPLSASQPRAFRDLGLVFLQSCLTLAARETFGCPCGLSPAPDAAPLPWPPSIASWHRCRAALSPRRFWERAGIAAAHELACTI